MANEVEIIVRARDLASHTLDKVAGKAEETSGRFGPLGKAAGLALGGIGLAAAAAAYEGVKMASTFQSSMEQLHTQAHVPQKAVDQLSQSVLNLAGKVGQGPDSLSEALYHIESSFASTGIKGSEAMHLLETSSEGAKLGHADLVDVTNALDAAVVSGIPGVKNFDQAMGMLNATVGAGDMHMQDLASAFGTGAVAVVKGYGLTLRDVGAALAVFGDNNIRGAKAGTQLRMTVQSLAVPSKGGAKALEELGLKADTLAKDMQSGGLIKAVTDLHEHLQKTGHLGKESGQILTEAFGKKAGVGLQMLVDQFDRLKSKYKEIDKGANTFSEAWAAQKKTFKQGWDDFTAGIESALTKLGLKLLPVLSKLLPAATAYATAAIGLLTAEITALGTVLDPVIGFIQDHSTIFGTLAVTVGTLVAAWKIWTGAILVWEGVTKVAIAVQAAFDAVLDANPIGLVIIALAGLAAGIIYAYTHSKTFRDIVQSAGKVAVTAFHAILAAVSAVVSWIKGHWPLLVGILLGPIGAAAAAIITHWRQIVGAVQSAWRTISSLGRSMWGGLVGGITAAVSWALGKIGDLVGAVRSAAQAVANLFSSTSGYRVNGGTASNPPQANHLQPFVGKATGGIIGHAAEGGARSGGTLVGEYGPELVDLAPGSTVHSNPDTRRMLSASGAGWSADDYTRNHRNHDALLAAEAAAHRVHEANLHAAHEAHNKNKGLHDPTRTEEHLAHLEHLGREGKLDPHMQHDFNKRLGLFRKHPRQASTGAGSSTGDFTDTSGGATAETVKVVLEINSGGTAMDDFLVQLLRKAVRTRGGNVQTVLGR